jgi:hypothetical protein
MSKDVIGTAAIIARLQVRYGAPNYAFFREVGDATGSVQRRWADGLAVSLWPSRGLTIEGFEVKASRADWKKELSDASKAERICRYCDHWWVVVGDAAIVKDGELPPTWGLLVPHGNGLKCQVKAPKLKPVPLNREFVAALARRASEQSVDQATVDAAYKEGAAAGRAERLPRRGSNEAIEQTLVKINEKIDRFQKATGLWIDGGDDARLRRLGEAVRYVLDGDEHLHAYMSRVASQAADVAKQAQAVADQLKKPQVKESA